MNTVEKITEEYMRERALAIDQEVIKFLREQGITGTTEGELRALLKERGLAFIAEYEAEGMGSGETHTLKLCKIFATHKFRIPAPLFTP